METAERDQVQDKEKTYRIPVQFISLIFATTPVATTARTRKISQLKSYLRDTQQILVENWKQSTSQKDPKRLQSVRHSVLEEDD